MLGGFSAQREGDGAHEDRRHGRGGELPTQQRVQTDMETPFPSAKITNIAAAGSDGGSPIYIACVEKGKRVCTQCPVTNLV